MSRLYKYILEFIVLFLILTIVANAQVAIIANKSVPIDNITKSYLFDLYSKDIIWWENNEPVIIFDLKPKTEVKQLFYSYLGKSPSRMKSIWLKKLLSGEGDPPEAVLSDEEMIQKIINTKGAIGFVDINSVTDSVKLLMRIE
ncbi:hypothetical protein ACFLS9_09180 [Bacteroidota bacterium]